MIVFDLDIEEFEYAYRLDGPYDEKKGLRFDKNKILLDPYALRRHRTEPVGACK